MADISVDYDTLIEHHEKWARGEANDASNAGERRQQIGQFAEDANVENKALSQIRAGLKIKNEGKRLDWLRSMEALLPLAALHIRGNSTRDAFDDEVEPEAPVETVTSGDPEFDEQVDKALAGEVVPFGEDDAA